MFPSSVATSLPQDIHFGAVNCWLGRWDLLGIRAIRPIANDDLPSIAFGLHCAVLSWAELCVKNATRCSIYCSTFNLRWTFAASDTHSRHTHTTHTQLTHNWEIKSKQAENKKERPLRCSCYRCPPALQSIDVDARFAQLSNGCGDCWAQDSSIEYSIIRVFE